MRRRGFSLFELMIVIGVVGIVWAALLPSVIEAREAALSVRCRANLHELAGLCARYARETGYLPWGYVAPGEHAANYWSNEYHYQHFGRENPALHACTNWSDYVTFCWDFRKYAGTGAGWQCGEMFGGRKAESILRCPKLDPNEGDNWDNNPMTGYNYNVCYLGYVENDKGKRDYPTALEKVTNPERVVVFGDGGYSGGPNKFMRAPFQDKTYDNSAASLRKAGTQAFRHGRGAKRHCNMAFLDGHVESFHQPYKAGGSTGWVHEQSHSAFISSGNGIYGPRGFGETDTQEPRM